jgi:hypothetical protein
LLFLPSSPPCYAIRPIAAVIAQPTVSRVDDVTMLCRDIQKTIALDALIVELRG